MLVSSRRFVLALTLAASLPLSLVGCTTARHASASFEAPALSEASVSGPAIDISNLRGNIDVRIDRRLKEISVESKVRVDKNGKHFDLDIINESVEVTSEIQDRGGLPVLVVTTTSRREEQDYFVDLTISMPAAEGIRVRSGGGEIRVSGVVGAVEIENATGPIEVKTPSPITQPFTIRTGSGNVYVQAPPQSTGRVTLNATGGRTILEANQGGVVLEKISTTMTQLTGIVNKGQNPITVSTVDGNVRLLLLDDPMARTRFRLDIP